MINLFFVVHDYSGARTYANELLGWLSGQRGITVHKVYWESTYYKEYTVAEEENLVSIHIPAIKREGDTLKKYSRRCIDLMSPLLQGKNVIIFHLNYSTYVKLGIEARTRFNTRLVYTLHYLPNYFSSFAAENIKPEETTATGDVLDGEIVKEADHIICVTRFAKEMLGEYFFVPETKMAVIYNGCSSISNDLPNNNFKEVVKKQLGFHIDDKIILFVGRLLPGKGVEKLMEAFKLLTNENENLRLVLIGKYELESFLMQCRDNFGRVSFPGQLQAEQVKQLYQIADIGVIPSEFEQCSYVALEMMQHSLPIVCSAVPGLKELFINGETALFASLGSGTDGLLEMGKAAQELYKAIRQLLTDKPLAKKLEWNAYENWQNHFTARHMGEATMEIYKLLQTAMLKTSNEFKP